MYGLSAKKLPLWRGGRQWRFHCKSTIQDVVFVVSDTGGSKINNLSSPSRSWTYDHLVSSPGALPLSFRKLVGAKLQSWAKNLRKMHLVCLILEYFPLKPGSLEILPPPPPPPQKNNVEVWSEQFCSRLSNIDQEGGVEGSSWCQILRVGLLWIRKCKILNTFLSEIVGSCDKHPAYYQHGNVDTCLCNWWWKCEILSPVNIWIKKVSNCFSFWRHHQTHINFPCSLTE